MAKRANKTNVPTTATETVVIESAPVTDVSVAGHTLDISKVSPAGLAYLLTYGFRQSMQDCVAGMAKEMRDDGEDDDAIKAALQETQDDRFESIMSGTVKAGGGRGPRLDAVTRTMRDIATAAIRAAATDQKKSMPTGKDLTGFIESYLAKHGESIRAEAEAELAKAKARAEDITL